METREGLLATVDIRISEYMPIPVIYLADGQYEATQSVQNRIPPALSRIPLTSGLSWK